MLFKICVFTLLDRGGSFGISKGAKSRPFDTTTLKSSRQGNLHSQHDHSPQQTTKEASLQTRLASFYPLVLEQSQTTLFRCLIVIRLLIRSQSIKLGQL